MSLVVLTNIPTPYRTAFFDALAEEAAQAGKSFHVLYCAETEPGRHWPYDASKMLHSHTVLGGIHFSMAGLHPHLNFGVVAQLRHLKPDTLIIAGSWNTPTMLIAGLDIYKPKPRRIFWSEGHVDAARHKSGPIAWMRRWAYQRFDGFAVPNAKSADWASAQAASAREIFTLPNSIDVDFFTRPSPADRTSLRLRHGLVERGRVLVQVSALTARKGVLELAKSFLSLPESAREGAQLVFVGDGELRAELAGIASSSYKAVVLLGQLPPESVREVLWASDAFVLNTHLDPNPLSAIEAAAAGLPVVMSARAGNVHEVVEAANTGFVIPNPSDPSATLRAALSASDSQLYEMGVRAARLARDQFDARAVARAIVSQLYPVAG